MEDRRMMVMVVEEGERAFSRVVLRGRRAAREAGCYGLFSPGVGATWTRCALPSAPTSTWFIAALADASVHGEVFENAGREREWVCVCVRVRVCVSLHQCRSVFMYGAWVRVYVLRGCLCTFFLTCTGALYSLPDFNLCLEHVPVWPSRGEMVTILWLITHHAHTQEYVTLYHAQHTHGKNSKLIQKKKSRICGTHIFKCHVISVHKLLCFYL